MSLYQRSESTRINLGTFTMSGVCRVTDPCYGRDAGLAGMLLCLPGKYTAFIRRGNTSWHERVTELEIVHESIDANVDRDLAGLFATNIDAGVDSGQCGFFDDAQYNGRDEEGEDPPGGFYDRCCNLTLEHPGGGVTLEGAVASSGFGDGGYWVYVDRDPEEGPIAFARLVFIPDNEGPEPEYEDDLVHVGSSQ